MAIIFDYKDVFDVAINKKNYSKAEKMAIWGLTEKESWNKEFYNNASINPFAIWINFWFKLWGLK